MAYDSSRQKTWMFGSGGSSWDTGGNELWHFDSVTKLWTKIIANGSVPPARLYHGFVYLPSYDKFILYGGAAGYGSSYTKYNDTWVYSPTSNTWTQLSTTVAPTATQMIGMVYDSVNNVIIVAIENEQFWLFRYAERVSDIDITPPAAPSGLSVS